MSQHTTSDVSWQNYNLPPWAAPKKVVRELSSATHPEKYKVNFHVVWFYIKKFIILMNISLVDVDRALYI